MNTKSLIVQQATKLFYEKGYVSVGLSEIIATTNTSKGSFYHHFPKGKEQLLVTCLVTVQQQVIEDVKRHFAEHITFKQAIRAIFTELIRIYEKTGQIIGYTFTSLVSELSIVSADVRNQCKDLYVSIEAIFMQQLIKRGMEQAIAARKALTLVAMIEGSIMLTTVKNSSYPLQMLAEELEQYIQIKGEDN